MKPGNQHNFAWCQFLRGFAWKMRGVIDIKHDKPRKRFFYFIKKSLN
ncbi:hypothetical protein L323_00800 [Ruminiclostridium papyrosolvens C7]|uniref:Uncharacterized protein n=1 Tax=Ruminiclostridium papyrosolvens C7 TaxID=1330534 RepID=U4R6J9_9FIRM|nr:hypothetical protein L323_00800 [Ruminiclostridium papyrosolvens C7]